MGFVKCPSTFTAYSLFVVKTEELKLQGRVKRATHLWNMQLEIISAAGFILLESHHILLLLDLMLMLKLLLRPHTPSILFHSSIISNSISHLSLGRRGSCSRIMIIFMFEIHGIPLPTGYLSPKYLSVSEHALCLHVLWSLSMM